jgi:phage FluMu gp28-like protein
MGKRKTIVTPKSILLPYQRDWVDDHSRFKAGVMARQTGKDFSSADEIVEDCFQVSKCPWLIAAPSERQSMETLGKVKEWTEAYKLAIDDVITLRESENPSALLKSQEIIYSNGSRVIAVPGKPDTVRGFSANVLMTEFAFFENPAATWRAILPSITNPLRGGEKKVRLISTPNGKGDTFHKIIRDNYRGPGAELDTPLNPDRKMKWSVHRITIYDAVRMGLPVDPEQLKEALDDPDGWAQEFECAFLDGSSVLLPYDVIALAESADARAYADPAMFFCSQFQLYLGIDFGRTNDPTVCVTLERIGDILWVREILVLRGMSSPDQEKLLHQRIKACRRCSFDYTGPGIGLGDYLVKEHQEWDPQSSKFGKIELCTFTAGLKREIFPKLRRAFEAPTKLRIPLDIELREDLHAMKQIVRNGEYSYSAPHTAEGHSDRCTALALALRAAGDATGPFHFSSVRTRSALRLASQAGTLI